MNKSSSPLLHLHLHHLHFFDNEQIFIFPKKKNQNFQFLEKIQDFKKFKKKKKFINQNFQFLQKNSGFPNFSKKKKKKKKEIFKKGLGTMGIRLVLHRFLSKKKIQNFQFLEKIQFFKKKSSIKNFNSMKKFKISKIFKKKKKKGDFQKRP